MRPLRALLVALCWRYSAVGSAATLQSPRQYSFEDLPADSGAVSVEFRTLTGVGECGCRQRCLSEATCRGFGYSESTAACRLTEQLPTPQATQSSSEDWRWHARNGVRRLGERCTTDQDCSLMVPGAACVDSVCGCHGSVEEDGGGGCQKAGGFIEVSGYQLTSGLLSDTQETSIDACDTSCATNLSCMAFDFAAAAGRCRTFAEGVTSDASPSDSDSDGDVRVFVWLFPRADGAPPDTYQQVGESYLRLMPKTDATVAQEAAVSCFTDGGILFPGVNKTEMRAVQEFLAGAEEATSFVWIGLTDILEEGHYITSDGRSPTDIAWDVEYGEGAPNGRQDCALIWRETTAIHDGSCADDHSALCQYVGENLALGQLSWMNVHHVNNPPELGNDGSQETLVHPPDPPQPLPDELTWTVDLGGPVQVTSVLYVARTSCCDGEDNRNRLTEIRVGSDPGRFDAEHSARCVWLEKPFVARGNTRLFRCAVPLTGRYVRLIRRLPERILDFAELAVFGNRLQQH